MAGRIPQPWFWEERQAWYVTLTGKRIRLGKNKDEAFRQFHRLMAEQGREPQAVAVIDPVLTVGELAQKYLADLKRRADGRTLHLTGIGAVLLPTPWRAMCRMPK